MKHTPGPWAYQYRLRNNIERSVNIFEMKTGDIVAIAVSQPTEASLANARLIAAAPELLAALQYLIATYPVIFTSTGIENAKVAIAKATDGAE